MSCVASVRRSSESGASFDEMTSASPRVGYASRSSTSAASWYLMKDVYKRSCGFFSSQLTISVPYLSLCLFVPVSPVSLLVLVEQVATQFRCLELGLSRLRYL